MGVPGDRRKQILPPPPASAACPRGGQLMAASLWQPTETKYHLRPAIAAHQLEEGNLRAAKAACRRWSLFREEEELNKVLVLFEVNQVGTGILASHIRGIPGIGERRQFMQELHQVY